MNNTDATPKWLRDLQFFVRRLSSRGADRHFSNFGEQQIIDKYIELFGIRENSEAIVDIGAGDGIRSSNTYHLFSKGWTGVGVEVDDAKYKRLAKTYRSFAGVSASSVKVTPENVADLLESQKIEPVFGLLSLDIDGNDYWVLDAILAQYRPRLIVSEYNEKIPPPIKFTVNYDPDFELRHHFFGYSIAKLDDLLQKYGYALLEVEYNNVFLAPLETPGVVNKTVAEAYREGYFDRTDRRAKFPDNENMEILQSVKPEDGIKFLDRFYSQFKGKYSIGLY